MADTNDLNVESLIQRLLEGLLSDFFFFFLIKSFISLKVRGCRPGKIVNMTENEVRGLCLKSREIFLSQPILLELEAPLKICGKYYYL